MLLLQSRKGRLTAGLIEMRSRLVALINYQTVLENGRPANLRKNEGEVK